VVSAFKDRLASIVAILRKERAKSTPQLDEIVLEKAS
jgi:hypothetical protein